MCSGCLLGRGGRKIRLGASVRAAEGLEIREVGGRRGGVRKWRGRREAGGTHGFFVGVEARGRGEEVVF